MKKNNNKVWIAVIAVLVVVIAALIVVLVRRKPKDDVEKVTSEEAIQTETEGNAGDSLGCDRSGNNRGAGDTGLFCQSDQQQFVGECKRIQRTARFNDHEQDKRCTEKLGDSDDGAR